MSRSLLLDCKPSRIEINNPDIRLEEDGEKIIIHTGLSMLLLEEGESMVFKMCNGQISLQEIISKIVNSYQISEEEVKEELIAFLQDLEQRGLVSW